jgi:hypothetical protein
MYVITSEPRTGKQSDSRILKEALRRQSCMVGKKCALAWFGVQNRRNLVPSILPLAKTSSQVQKMQEICARTGRANFACNNFYYTNEIAEENRNEIHRN